MLNVGYLLVQPVVVRAIIRNKIIAVKQYICASLSVSGLLGYIRETDP